jgi:hypothetical protein
MSKAWQRAAWNRSGCRSTVFTSREMLSSSSAVPVGARLAVEGL